MPISTMAVVKVTPVVGEEPVGTGTDRCGQMDHIYGSQLVLGTENHREVGGEAIYRADGVGTQA